MSEKEHENIIESLIEALSQRRNGQKQNTESLPVPYQRADSLPSPSRPSIFTRMFDPSAAMKADFEDKQLQLMIDARLNAMGHKAKAYDETTRIDEESRVRLHEHDRLEQEEVQKRYAKARAEIQKHVLQQNLMAELADYQLDPMDEQFLIAKIVRIMMNSDQKESSNGR